MNRIESAILTKVMNHLSNYISQDEKIQVIEPLSCMMRLAILSFKPRGSKICIYENSIYIQEPGPLQGSIRWISGDKRDDLHYLLNPINKALIKWNPNENEDVKNIYELAIKGLMKLKRGYNCNSCSSLTSHSIDLYINCIKDRIKGTNNPENLIIEDHSSNQCNFFEKLWSIDQISLINNLFKEAENNKNDSNSYLEAIENILSTKIKSCKEIVVKNIQTAT